MKKLLLSSLTVFMLVACSNTEKNEVVKEDSVEVLENNFESETQEYKKFVEEQIDMLLKDTEQFAKDLNEGNLEKAKKDYPIIRMAYEKSEPIAESFGESDVNIDFRLADYLEENKTEDGWRGFHKIEKILWEENTTKGTEEIASQLVNDIKELKAKILTVDVTVDMMLTGAVDLLNEVATSKITGEEEIYSHTDLYDFKANLDGAYKIFEIFKAKLEAKDASLVKEIEDNFKEVNDLLKTHMIDDVNYKLYTELTNEDTKKLAESVTKLGEPLSQMGIIVEVE